MPRVAAPPGSSTTDADSPVTSARPSVTVMTLVPPSSAILPEGAVIVTDVGSLSVTSTESLPVPTW